MAQGRIMADMDYDTEISPWGQTERQEERERGRGSRNRLHRTLKLMWSLWLWASEMTDSRVNGYCGEGCMVLIF